MVQAEVVELLVHQELVERAASPEQVEAAEHRADALAQSSTDANRSVAELRQQLDAEHTAQARTEAELADLRSAQSTNDAVTLVQEKEIQALNQKLREQSASVERVLILWGKILCRSF